jgi:hypothetical protein
MLSAERANNCEHSAPSALKADFLLLPGLLAQAFHLALLAL